MSQNEPKIKTIFVENNLNKSLSNNEINTLIGPKQNNVNSIDLDINKEFFLSYGNYKILMYDKNGDPLFLIGPDYTYFLSMLIVNLLYLIVLSGFFIYISPFYINIFGIILNMIQFMFFILCGIKNPGLPKKEIQNEFLLIQFPNQYKKCQLCKFIIDKTKKFSHCEICGCCCEGYDHHCPWTSKCVGKGNIFYFHSMIIMVFFILLYLIISLIFSNKIR